jgi:hypothetical protein
LALPRCEFICLMFEHCFAYYLDYIGGARGWITILSGLLVFKSWGIYLSVPSWFAYYLVLKEHSYCINDSRRQVYCCSVPCIAIDQMGMVMGVVFKSYTNTHKFLYRTDKVPPFVVI